MNDIQLTMSERLLLQAVDNCPDKVTPWADLQAKARNGIRKGSGMLGLSFRGFNRVMDRMIERNLLGYSDDNLTITFKGLIALRGVRA